MFKKKASKKFKKTTQSSTVTTKSGSFSHKKRFSKHTKNDSTRTVVISEKLITRRKRRQKRQNTVSEAEKIPRYVFNTDIPEKYHENYICAIPKNPEMMFVYWEFTPDTNNNGRGPEIGSKLVLRLKETSHENVLKENVLCENLLEDTVLHDNLLEDVLSIPETADLAISNLEISDYTGKRYLKLPELKNKYTLEGGHLTPEGNFFPIKNAKPIEIKKAPIAQSIDSSWDLQTTDDLISYSAETVSVKEAVTAGSQDELKAYLGSASLDN